MQKTFGILFIAILGATCTRHVQSPTPLAQCLAHFQAKPKWPDTLHCFLADDVSGAPLSDALLQTVLDSAQFATLHFGSGEARFWALEQFPFANGLRACILRTEEFWFGKQCLLIFDLKNQKCRSVVELAHFYGGDSGQTASESWLFRNKRTPQLFVKNAEHWLSVSDASPDEPQEHLLESGQLFQWQSKQFIPIPNPDSLLFLRRYSMHRTW